MGRKNVTNAPTAFYKHFLESPQSDKFGFDTAKDQ